MESRSVGHRALAAAIAVVTALGILYLAESPAPAATDGPLRVYVITVDGLKPDEVTPELTPNLWALRSGGTWYDQARAVFPAETLPNHVAMMTGVQPERNGVLGNQFFVPNKINSERRTRHYMQHPFFLESDTLVTRLERSCADDGGVDTATVQSKTYLEGVFQGEPLNPADPMRQLEADFHWEAPAHVPQSDHIFDALTMDAFRTWIEQRESSGLPQFAFVNLGDVDRAGHADEGGYTHPNGLTPLRQGAIEDADAQLGLLIDDLKKRDAWDDTIMIVNSDHGMDWGPQQNRIDMSAALQAHGLTNNTDAQSAHFAGIGSGGAGLIYVHQPVEIPQIAKWIEAIEGVEFIATKEPVPGENYASLAEMGLDHPNAPDIVLFAEKGWHVDDTNHQNPLPGNHAHPITQRSTLMVGGGHAALADASVVQGEPVYDPTRARLFAPPDGGPGNMSVAPTVAELFGLGEIEGGYDVPALAEAFEDGAFETTAVCDADFSTHGPGIPATPEPSGDPAMLTVAIEPLEADLEKARYGLVVTNRGDAVAPESKVSMTVPSSHAFQASTPAPTNATTCVEAATAGTSCEWSVPPLAAGEAFSIPITYTWTGTGSPFMTASVTAPDLPVAQATVAAGFERLFEVFDRSTFVDESEPANTNHGACPDIHVTGDNRVTSYVDGNPAADWDWGFYPEQHPYEVLQARALLDVKATTYSVDAPGVIGLHPIRGGDWAQGSDDCAGAPPQVGFSSVQVASKERWVRTGWTPVFDEAPAAAFPVTGPGEVGVDVTDVIDTVQDRRLFNGFAIRDATTDPGSPGDADATTSFDTVGPAFGIEYVIRHALPMSARCVDVDPGEATVPADREVRLEAFATNGNRVVNGGGDTCSGTPLPKTEIEWRIEDDAPDSFVAVAQAAPMLMLPQPDGGLGPNGVGTFTNEQGLATVGLRAADPSSAGTARVAGLSGFGVLDPDENVLCGSVSPCPGEGENEEDVQITWTAAAEPTPTPTATGSATPTPTPTESGSSTPSPTPTRTSRPGDDDDDDDSSSRTPRRSEPTPAGEDEPAATGARSLALIASREIVRSGARVILSGRLISDTADCVPSSVSIARAVAGDDHFEEIKTVEVDRDGSFESPVTVRKNSEFVAAVGQTEGCSWANSDVIGVDVRARVTASLEGRHRRTAKLVGRVFPTGSGTVRLERRMDGDWIEVAAAPVDRSSYGFLVRRGWRGFRTFRVRFEGDGVASLPGSSRTIRIEGRRR